MHSQLRAIAVAFGCAMLALSPVRTSAEPATGLPAAALEPQDVRAALRQVGYSVAESSGSGGGQIRMVEAHSTTGSEVVRVLVFADTAAATAAHRQATLDDARLYSDDVGPQLLSGFGASAWRRNVAMLQTSPQTFGLLMPPAVDCVTNGTATVVPYSDYTVDRAAIEAIQSFHTGA